MHLKHLEIQGFKSFPDKTKLSFTDGLTAVVGPNGSGKSNISDAMRWVFGEQSTKTLRSQKMEDVIFGGTQNRKSSGFCEVSVCIDNILRELPVDNDEVLITRKYYRSGDSEYLINGGPVRLKDINEMFMDTGLGKDGYSIIGQGKITEIVSAKSNERREIFEEAAGISKFRYRKAEAEKKLVLAQDNLSRLNDILIELESRVEPLKIQSEKAKKFLDFSQTKKNLEISHFVWSVERINVQLNEQTQKMFECQSSHQELLQSSENIEKEIACVYTKMQEITIEIDNLRTKKNELEQTASALASDIAIAQNNKAHNIDNIERIKGEIQNLNLSSDEISTQVETKIKEIEDCKNQIEQLNNSILELSEQLLSLNQQNSEFDNSIHSKNQKLNSLLLEKTEYNTILSTSDTQKQELEAKTIELEKSISLLAENDTKLKEELKTTNELLAEIDDKKQGLENSIGGYTLKITNRKQKQAELLNQFNALDLQVKEKLQKSKLLEDLERNLEGFGFSIKTILNASKTGELNGVFGTVSQLINVNNDYALAIETALGAYLQNIVVDNETTAKAGIRLLKSKNSGRATFLPVSTISGNELNSSSFENFEGYIGIASSLVSCDNKFRAIINSVLGKVVVVNNLDDAVSLAQKNGYKFKIVTKDGQVINAGGSLSGGSAAKSSGILSRKGDIEKLKQQAEEIVNKKAKVEVELAEVTAQVEKLDAEIVAIQSEITVINEDTIRFNGEKKRIEQFIEQSNVQLRQANNQLLENKQKLENFEAQKQNAQAYILELSNSLEQLEAEIESHMSSTSELKEKRELISQRVSDLKLQKVQFENSVVSINAFIEDLEFRKTNSVGVVEQLNQQVQQLNSKDEQLDNDVIAFENQIVELNSSVEKTQNAISQSIVIRDENETIITELRAKEKKIAPEREAIIGTLARIEERKISIQKEYDSLVSRMYDEYQITRSEAEALASPVENPTLLQKQINELKSKIKALGNVNVAAIDEYAEVSMRYEFLSSQVNDVKSSIVDLTKLIDDLTSNMKEIFEQSFIQINKHFKEVFTELFDGGTAELKLTEPDNILNSGIEIFVQPPGKIIKNLELLSGGEKSFVAIAIYFAISKVKPAPFCILDEIEAALDDVNVVKYAKYLRQMSANTQYILITHRRGTMEESDVIYGVTMQHEGISKLLQLKVWEIENKLGKIN